MHLRRLLPLRRLAALVAMGGLLALPLRPLLACPMLEAPGAATAHADGDHAGMDHDGMHHDVEAEAQDPAPASHGPSHDVCPDIAHCVAVVLRDGEALLPSHDVATADTGGDLPARPASAGRTLDTPPPKQA